MNRYPLVLPRSDIRRILERHATRMVRTPKTRPGSYVIQDASVVRHNQRVNERGGLELLDPAVFAIEITDSEQMALGDVGYRLVRACGFHTQRDFYDSWLQRRRHLDPLQIVYVLSFHLVEQPRFLHRRPHLGYTLNPALAARGEPEALSRADLEQLAAGNRARMERERSEELRRREARSQTVRYREAIRTGRFDDARAVIAEMNRLVELSA